MVPFLMGLGPSKLLVCDEFKHIIMKNQHYFDDFILIKLTGQYFDGCKLINMKSLNNIHTYTIQLVAEVAYLILSRKSSSEIHAFEARITRTIGSRDSI